MADNVKGNFRRHLILHLRNVSLTLCPGGKTSSYPCSRYIGNDVFVKEASGVGKSVCYVEVPYVCDFLRSECDVTMKF